MSSSTLHWVTYDPTEKGPRRIESSVRLHLSARAKTKHFHKIEAKKDGILRSKARDIVGWRRKPRENRDQSDLQAESSASSTSGSESSSPPRLTSLKVQFESHDSVQDHAMTSTLQPDPSFSVRLGRSLDFRTEDSLGDFALPLIQYVTTVWLPGALSIPLNCQIGGYSPIYAGDDDLAHTMLQKAFNSGQQFFPLALSAFISARMKFASSIPLSRGHEPEYFAGQAIRALRQEIAVDHEGRSGASIETVELTALGLAFLMLTASFTQADHKAINLYGRMMNHAIWQIGGIAMLSEFASYFVIVTDFLTATANLCPTAICLNQNQSMEMVEIQSCDLSVELEAARMHARLGTAVESHQMMQSVLGVVLSGDETLVCQMRTYVQKHSATYYRVATGVMQPDSQELALDTRRKPEGRAKLILADRLISQARYLSISIWLRLLTLNILSAECRPLAESGMMQPEILARDGCQILECLTIAQNALKDTGWAIPSWLVIWIVAVLSCLLPLQRDHGIGPHLLDGPQIYRFVQMTESVRSKILLDRTELEHILAKSLPLDVFEEFDIATLKGIIENGRFHQSEFWLS